MKTYLILVLTFEIISGQCIQKEDMHFLSNLFLARYLNMSKLLYSHLLQANLKNILVCCVPTDPPFYPVTQ